MVILRDNIAHGRENELTREKIEEIRKWCNEFMNYLKILFPLNEKNNEKNINICSNTNIQ